MNSFWIGISALLMWSASLAIVAVWSRKDTWGRTAIVALFAISVPILSITFGASLGQPRPISWDELLQEKEISRRLLGYKIIYEVGIYILLDMEGQPVYLELDWNTKVAENLGDAIGKAGGDGEVWFKFEYETSLDENVPQFHALPQPRFLPDKTPTEAPEEYERNQ